MPKIDINQIGLAFDMQGCPNRCRHCWLGPANNYTLSEQDVRWGTSLFRDFIAREDTSINRLSVATSFREPDLRDDYRKLYDLEAELGDGIPDRYELLSIWRLARDDSYARWAKSVGPDVCQISFFGLRVTNDWFHRRKGAFDDALIASERLLDAGMKPRWQIILTTKLLPELNELLALIDKLKLRERVRKLGDEFLLFIHLPGPDHEARKIEDLRPTIEQLINLPEVILESTRKYFSREVLWQSEEALFSDIVNSEYLKTQSTLPEALWFFVQSNWDVFSNIGTLEDWWCLGNLKRDNVVTIINRFVNDGTLGLKYLVHESPSELARQYGNPNGHKVYSSEEDLLSLYLGRHCEKKWNRRSIE
ncbi:MAG: hypothetical protein K8S15_05940 [Candidatus Aegiribacteria sp.]|nr:hypothetical protein [Candidatus Aegiribacteria sp.]